jgi:hypothetical protein
MQLHGYFNNDHSEEYSINKDDHFLVHQEKKEVLPLDNYKKQL